MLLFIWVFVDCLWDRA